MKERMDCDNEKKRDNTNNDKKKSEQNWIIMFIFLFQNNETE